MECSEWIQRVFDAAVSTWREEEQKYGHILGIPIDNLAEPLGLVTDRAQWYGSDGQRALFEAINDLEGISLIKTDYQAYSLTEHGELAVGKQISSGWRTLTSVTLTDRQQRFIRQVAELGHQEHDTYARLIHVNAAEAWALAGAEPPGLAFSLAKQLEDKGLAQLLPLSAGEATLRLTYAGFIRATKGAVTEDQRLVEGLLAEWETVETDVKEILKLDSPTEKAEFARDILGLVNTKARALRYLLLGFNNETRQFTTNPDPKNDRDRMEDILGSHCAPLPTVKYSLVPWAGGAAGLVEVVREPAKLPYRATRSGGKLRENGIYVRHGTHVTEADPEELADLIAEGERARAAT